MTSETNKQEFTPVDAGLHGIPKSQNLLNRDLGVWSIVFMVVAAAAPLAVVVGSVPIVIAVSNSEAVPLYYAAATVILLLFSVGFTVMSKYIKNAGAFYSYVQAGLGRITGVGAATLALVSYVVLLIGIYAYLGVAISNILANYTGLETHWWIWTVVGMIGIGILGYRDIELSAKVLGIILIIEAVTVVLLNIAIIGRGGEAGLSLAPFAPSGLAEIGAPIGITLAILGFIGFEATAVFRNEAKNPDKTIPKATYIAVIFIGVFYSISSWAIVVGSGVGNAIESAGSDPENFVLNIAAVYIAPVFYDIIQFLLATSIIACALTFHNVLTRYQFSLGKNRILPASLGKVHEKHRSPSFASLVLSIVVGVLMVIVFLTGIDPVTQAYTWFLGGATLGLMALMALTSLAVIAYFRKHKSADSRLWHTMVAPILAFVGLGGIVFMVCTNFIMLVGDPLAALIVGFAVPTAFAAGIIIAAIMRAREPEAYEALLDDD